MMKFSYAHCILSLFLEAGFVISYLPDELNNGAGLGFTDQQAPISVPIAGDLATILQGSSNLFDDFVVNPSDVQSQTPALNGQFDPNSGQAHEGEKTAFLVDGSTGGGQEGTDILIPSVPTQILEGVPELFDAAGKWFSNQKKPECKVNKYLLCCEKGAPQLKGGKISVGRVPSLEPKVHPDLLEYSQRRRQCHSCRQNPLPSVLSPGNM